MSKQKRAGPHDAVVQEAARLICEERLTDYRAAKLRAMQRLGLGPHTALPDNLHVREAVVAYQRLFGGEDYVAHLRAMRNTALKAMGLLAEFQPRLVGGAVHGAVTTAHRVQLHAFSEKAEVVDLFLQHRGIPFEQDERAYHYADEREVMIPLARFEAADIGIDVAVFAVDDQRRAPIDPSDGAPSKRLDVAAVQALLDA